MAHENAGVQEVLHQNCGGTVQFERRRLPGAEESCAVLVCQRCALVITATSELNPPGPICGVVLADVAEAIEQGRGDGR